MADFSEKILKMESENHLFRRNFNGFYYWIYLREEIILKENWGEGNDTKIAGIKTEVRKKKKHIRNLVNVYRKHNAMRQRTEKEVLFFHDATVFNSVSGCYESNILSPVIDMYREHAMIISDYSLYSDEKKWRYPETCFLYQPAIETGLIRRIYRIFRIEKGLKRKLECEIGYLVDLFHKYELNYIPDRNELLEKVYYFYLLWKMYSRFYKKILEKTKPKVIVEQCYYSTFKMMLNQVAETMGIPTVELQHGVMGDHRAYNFLDKNIYGFPKYVFVFSELWKKNSRLPIADENVVVTGSCNIDPSKIEKNGKKKEMKGNDTILFIGQDQEELFEYALHLCEIIKEKGYTDYRIIYKLHPCDKSIQQKKERIMEYSDIISVVDMYEKSLYECFLEADIQVGVSSTGLFEGVAYGLTTYIVDTPGLEVVQPLIDMGYAKLIVHEEDILEKKEFKIEDISKVWECHAVDNIRKAINTIIYGKKE